MHRDEALLDTRRDAIKLYLGELDEGRHRRWCRRHGWMGTVGVTLAVSGLIGALFGVGGVVVFVVMLGPMLTWLIGQPLGEAVGARLSRDPRRFGAWTALPMEEPPVEGERRPSGQTGVDRAMNRGAKYGWQR